jgi:hypothetical protein
LDIQLWQQLHKQNLEAQCAIRPVTKYFKWAAKSEQSGQTTQMNRLGWSYSDDISNIIALLLLLERINSSAEEPGDTTLNLAVLPPI